MKVPQVIGAHDPDEMHARATPDEILDRRIGVAGPEIGFEIADIDARMLGQCARRSQAFGEWGKTLRILERITGCDQPPHPIEVEPPHRQERGRAMRRVRRIERAAE